jgi:hypothetical protein
MNMIERLRGGVYGLNRIALCSEAADEIERQQKELQRQALDYLALDTQAQELTAERDALRADAERYRWLRREESDTTWLFSSGAYNIKTGLVDIGDMLTEEELDAAIDAARSKT